MSRHGRSLGCHPALAGGTGRPLEIQLFEWASQTAMDGYMSDPRRTTLAGDRDRAIARTEIVPVQFT